MPFNGERFRKAIKNKKLYLQDLVDELRHKGIEITLAGIKSYTRKTNNNTPRTETLSALADILGVSTDYLLGKDLPLLQTTSVPLIGKASCGQPKDYDLSGYEHVPISLDLYREGMYAVEAEGDSMSPVINNGDIVYCMPNQAIDNGKMVHYGLNGESGIKKYKINESGTIILLLPINPDYEIITINCEDNHDLFIARVVRKMVKYF